MSREVFAQSRMRWEVVETTYATYDEIKRDGDKPAALIAADLSFEAAKAMVARLGFAYSMRPDRVCGGLA